MSSEVKRLRIELLVAGPPTRKCKQLIEMMTSFVSEFPDQLRLDIYYAGDAMLIIPTDGYQRDPAGQKNRRVPSAYINGVKVASREVPEKEKVKEVLLQQLARPQNEWQD